jgi:hypothetical protein
MTSTNANEPPPSTTSGFICHPISPMTQSTSPISNNKQNSSIYNFIENNEQTKWRSTTGKYHIENLLQ